MGEETKWGAKNVVIPDVVAKLNREEPWLVTVRTIVVTTVRRLRVPDNANVVIRIVSTSSQARAYQLETLGHGHQ